MLTKNYLPVQLGRLSLQNPVEEQNSIFVPFRENPSLQVKRHFEPKLKCPRGWEQFIDRGNDKARMALHCTAEMWKGYKISCLKTRTARQRFKVMLGTHAGRWVDPDPSGLSCCMSYLMFLSARNPHYIQSHSGSHS